jgi:hypothetical protein
MIKIQIISCLIFLIACTDSKKDLSDKKLSEENSTVKSDTLQSDIVMRAEITCPKCGFKKKEQMPTEVCLIKYTCAKCKTDLFPNEGDCCVFCTYSPVKCPSMQED